MLAVILQARIDSDRLKAKSLLPLGGKPLVFRAMEALNRVPAGLRILACPEDSVSSFAPLAKEAGFELLAGPKEDVLGRYCLAIRSFGVTRLIRATGDNPFVFADAAVKINTEATALSADYSGYSGLPYGAGVESVLAQALLSAQGAGPSAFEREHVCPYLYSHPELFCLHRPVAPMPWRDSEEEGKSIRLTVDTQEDYERAQILYDKLEKTENRYCGEVIIRRYREIFQK